MQIICLFFPGLVACTLQNILEKKEWSVPKLAMSWGTYCFVIDLVIMMFYEYVLKNEVNWAERFTSNSFVIHYPIIAGGMAIVLPVAKAALNPFVSLKLERKQKKDEKK